MFLVHVVGNYGAILDAIEMSKTYFRPHLSTHDSS